MIFYDFEVYKYDWLTVCIDMVNRKEYVIINDPDALGKLYNEHVDDIWIGFNNKHYDQYIYKSILLGMNPKDVSDGIIKHGKEGWSISKQFRNIPMIQYDVFGSRGFGLKTLEGFMGSNIKETDVPFDIDRKLTPEEIQSTVRYCRMDVEQTIKVFTERINDFNSMYDLVKVFNLPLNSLGDSGAHVVSKVLGCKKYNYQDEFDFYFLPNLQIKKYTEVLDWFSSLMGNPTNLDKSTYYKRSFTTTVAGVPHTFGFGGLHGAPKDPVHYKGAIYHVDVNNYYPSILIAWDLVTRSATNDKYAEIYQTRKQLKMKQLNASTKEEAKMYKKMQLPYKQLLNALSGAMKDWKNNAYDPRNNNVMCINGQLMLLDLIEHLENIPGFQLIQSNTDGLIIMIPDTEEAFNQMDDICYDWETRCSTSKCSIGLATDQISEIYQKDVNNYLWIDLEGNVERKGAYLKELSLLDNDLPIINMALVNYMVNKTPIEQTINNCNDLIQFQKLVKLSDKYHYVKHNDKIYDYKCYRVFASRYSRDGTIYKVRRSENPGEPEKLAKFGNTPEKCFIDNSDVTSKKVSDKLDRQWYIELAKKRLEDFGI